jgi:fibro-slime domain-containing protein
MKNILIKRKIVYSVISAIIAFSAVFTPVSPTLAVDPLVISNITYTTTGNSATVTWRTNRAAAGQISYGTESNSYAWTLRQNDRKDIQSVTLNSLAPKTTYYFQIIASDQTGEVIAFERNFKTADTGDNQSPTISNLRVISVTGNTFTVQWTTDELSTSVVDYGTTSAFGKTVSDGAKVTVHDITVKGLQPATKYFFRVKSKDKDNNTTVAGGDDLRTLNTDINDKEPLTIYAIEPSGENNLLVGQTTATIHWRTNKLASGTVRYGTTVKLGKTANTPSPRDFENSVTLVGLTPNTTYYYEIQAKDIFGKTVKSSGFAFTTKGGTVNTVDPSATSTPPIINPNPVVLGSEVCDPSILNETGYYGLYYNLTSDHPDVRNHRARETRGVKVGRENDWYSAQYFAFSRVDRDLNFGNRFFPVNLGAKGDPNDFAVNWRALMVAPEDGIYGFELRADDDAWLMIDNVTAIDLSGIHPAQTKKITLNLSKGYHKLEIFYADRGPTDAVMVFLPDARLAVHPLPEGCEIADITSGPRTGPGGVVLGAATTDYTPATALYKTNDSPDIWAILANGQRHYITSPVAFDRYGYRWSDVQTVSRAKLESYPIAQLARTPEDATVYRLFTRPDHKWLKMVIPSPTVFISYSGNFWGNVVRIDALDINAYPTVQYIKIADTHDIYKVEGNTKRRVASPEVLSRLNVNPAEIVTVNQIHADSYVTSETLQ